MDGAWGQFAPPMPVEQPADGRFVHLLAHPCFKRLLDLCRRGDGSGLRLGKKEGEELLLLLQRQILMAPSPFARRFHRRHPAPVVGRDELMDGLGGHSTVLGNLLSVAWVNERLIDDEPALPAVGTRIMFPTLGHFFHGQMGGGTGDTCCIVFVAQHWPRYF